MRAIRFAKRKTRLRGVAAVEFAIILPLLMLIILGAIDFGRFAHAHIAVTNAARAGAGYGIMNPFNTADTTAKNVWVTAVTQAVRDELQQVIDADTQFNEADLEVTATRVRETDSTGTPTTSGLMRVTVDATYPFETFIAWPGIPSRLNLRHEVVMRAIR